MATTLTGTHNELIEHVFDQKILSKIHILASARVASEV